MAVPLIDAHAGRRDNPHNVTAAQINATTPAQVNGIVEGYFSNKDAWMVFEGGVQRVYQKSYTVEEVPAEGGEPGETVTVTHVSTNLIYKSGDAFPPGATGELWKVVGLIQQQLDGKADNAWGSRFPSGAPNPAWPVSVNIDTPSLVLMSGLNWASYGDYHAIAASGDVLYTSGENGSVRQGPDILNGKWWGHETRGSVIIGIRAQGIAVDSQLQEAYLIYPYAGSGDFPFLSYTPDLTMPFEPLGTDPSVVRWHDNEDGTATTTVAATGPRGFWMGRSSVEAGVRYLLRYLYQRTNLPLLHHLQDCLLPANDPLRRLVYLSVVTRVPFATLKKMMLPDSPLVRKGILHERGDLSPTRTGERLFKACCQSPTGVKQALIGPAVTASLTPEHFRHLNSDFRHISTLLSAATKEQTVGVNILLYGHPGTGKTEFAKTLAHAAGATLYDLPKQDMADKYGRINQLAMALNILADDTNSMILFDQAEDVFFSPQSPSFTSPACSNPTACPSSGSPAASTT